MADSLKWYVRQIRAILILPFTVTVVIGAEYEEYCRNVPRFFPGGRLGIHDNITGSGERGDDF